MIERNCNIMKDYGNGYSIEELAAKYRLSVRTCYRALDDAKQEARIQLAQVEDARKAEILAAYKNSVPLKEMIAKFNVAEGYCSMVANDAGLTENRRNERIKIRQKPAMRISFENTRVACRCRNYPKNISSRFLVFTRLSSE